MEKFGLGDRIKMKEDCSGAEEGKIYTLKINQNTDRLTTVSTAGLNLCDCEHKWEKIKIINNKFEKGDIVVSIDKNGKYSETKEGWKGKVLSCIGDSMQVESIEKQKNEPMNFNVDTLYFELETKKPIIKKSISNLEAAAKAMRRTGPTKIFNITVELIKEIEAHDEEEAEEFFEEIPHLKKHKIIKIKEKLS